MDAKSAKRLGVDLMSEAKCLVLSTIDEDGYPQSRAIFNLRNSKQFPELIPVFEEHNDDLLIYIGTNTSSEKIRQIRRNPKASVFFYKPSEFHGLMLSGTFEFIEDQAIKNRLWQDGWERYYPDGPTDPDYTVIRMIPRMGKGWYKGQPFNFTLVP